MADVKTVQITPVVSDFSSTSGSPLLWDSTAAKAYLLADGDVVTQISGSGTGSVTSVSGTGTVNGITLTGTVTTSGSLTLGGTLSGVSLTTQVTGTLPYANGGTGATSFTNHGVVVAGASALSTVAPSTSGNLLTSNGTDWTSAAPATSGTVTSVSVTPNAGVSAVVSNPTTTPTLTFTLGAITPTSVNANSGAGAITGGVLTGNSDAVIHTLTVGLGTNSVTGSTALGDHVLSGANSGQYNTAIGFEALKINTSGPQNTAIGASALTANTTGSSNVAIGVNTLLANVSTNNNTAVGHHSLQANIATGNTAVGYNALGSNTSGTVNLALGIDALSTNLSGGQNVGIGDSALKKSINSRNVAVGASAGANLTTSDNTAIGVSALFTNTTGSQNTAIGKDSLYYNTAINCTAIGTFAAQGSGAYSTTGGTYIGFDAGDAAATGSDYSTFFGYQSGFGVTTGARNILIGPSTISASKSQVTTGSNNISIGNDVAVSSATASNQLCIGNFIYGTGLSGAGSSISTAYIGFGIKAPSAVLHLPAGTASAGTAPLKINSGTLLTTAEVGAIEFLTDTYYGTITTGAARKTFAFTDSALVPASVAAVGTVTGSNLTVWSTFTPNRTGWTDVGSATVTGRKCKVGNVGYFQVKVVPGVTTATVAGTSYIDLPFTAAGIGGDASMTDLTTFVSVGNCVVDATNSRVYVPAQAATSDSLNISGWFEV